MRRLLRLALSFLAFFAASANAAPPALAWAVTTTSSPPLDVVENGFLNVPDVGPRSAMDSAGNLYVAASTFGSPPCAVILKYSGADGSIAWRRDICPGFTGALALDSAGDVFVAGASSSDALVAKLSGADGTTLWQQVIPAGTNHAAAALSIGVDAANDARVAVHDTGGILTVYGFANDGSVQWQRALADPLGVDKMNAFAVASNGSSVLQDFLTDGNNQAQSRLTLLDNFGSVVWQVAAGGAALAFDPNADVIDSGFQSTVKRSGATGAILWSQGVGGAIAVDSLGNVYVSASAGPSSDSDIAAYKIAADGTLAWSNVLTDSTTRGFGGPIALDPQGNPVAAALALTPTSTKQPTIKYSAADGHILWIGTDADASVTNRPRDIRAGASGTIELGTAFQGSTQVGLRLLDYTDVPASGAKADPAVTLASSTNPSVAGQTVTFVANVNGSAGAAGGTVDFLDGISVIAGCAAVPVSGGSATCATSSLVAGDHTIIATYSGDAAYNSDSAPALAQTVNAAAKADTTTTIFGPPNGGMPGQSVFFNAVVTGDAGIGSPTGTVAFFDGSTVIAGCEAVRLAPGGSGTSNASCATTTLAIGVHTINAQYSGNFAYNPSSGSFTIDIENPPPATVSFTSSQNPSTQGQSVTFTWTLTGNSGAPTGTADFLDGSSVIAGCTAVPLSGSAVSCTTSALAAGTHSISARYSGDATNGPTTTPPQLTISQTVQAGGASTDLALSAAANPDPASVGRDVVFAFTVANHGPLDASNVSLTTSVPSGSTFVWSSAACSGTSTVACTASSLPNGASITFTLVVRPTAAGSVTANATVSAAQADSAPGNNDVSLGVPVNASAPAQQVLRYRLYSPVTQEHLYTIDKNEYDTLSANGNWNPEGTEGRVLDNPGSFNGVAALPNYRLYNSQARLHHWTTDPNEYYTLIQFPGWNGEGVDGFLLGSNAAGTTALLRLMYPDGRGLHLWTIDRNEYDTLIATYGWVGEGTVGFVIQ